MHEVSRVNEWMSSQISPYFNLQEGNWNITRIINSKQTINLLGGGCITSYANNNLSWLSVIGVAVLVSVEVFVAELNAKKKTRERNEEKSAKEETDTRVKKLKNNETTLRKGEHQLFILQLLVSSVYITRVTISRAPRFLAPIQILPEREEKTHTPNASFYLICSSLSITRD